MGHADRFQRQLRETGVYTTEAGGPRGLDRLFGRLDAWYYWHIMGIVWSGGRDARAGRYDEARWTRSSFETIHLLERCGCRMRIVGAKALAEAGGPAVIVANHMSMAETFVLPAIVLAFRPVSFVVKESLLRYPYFGDILGACHPISVTRENPRQDLKEVLRQGQAALAGGRCVVVFPQATRSTAFVPAAFNTLGVKLAARAGVPVVPLALKTDFQGAGRVIKDFGPLDRRQPMHYAFGAPLDPRDNEKAVHAAVVDFIRTRMLAWGGEVRESGAAQEAGAPSASA